MNRRLPLAAGVALAALACSPRDDVEAGAPGPTQERFMDDSLRRDLQSDSRDALYRAANYVARQGGPAVPAASDPAALVRHGQTCARWLAAQPEGPALELGYRAYTATWSPVFPD